MFNTAAKILIIDDMLTIRKIAKKILSDLHFSNIFEASDGAEAWQIINSQGPFDVIISDWNMPKMDGLTLLQHLRSHPEFSDTPFIMLTAESDMEQVRLAADAGVDNYILKPFTNETFITKLEKTHKKYIMKKAV